ncbi:MAG: hypothetical protein ACK5TO_20570 [Planctomycetaceae bacterium]
MDADDEALERWKMPLLQELAGIKVKPQRRRGVLKEVPHFNRRRRTQTGTVPQPPHPVASCQ